MSELVTQIKKQAETSKKVIALPEATEPRMVKAAEQIYSEGFAEVVLIGSSSEVQKVASQENVDLNTLTIIDPETSDQNKVYSENLYEMRKHKGIERQDAEQMVQDPMCYAALMVKQGDADGYVAGAANTTADTFRPALQIIKTAPNVSCVSSSFIIIVPNCEYGENGLFVFADCALNPDPDSDQLAEIAVTTANTTKSLVEVEPRVGMLSFSTKGSAEHEFADKVATATVKAKQKQPELQIDGELQFDAAILPSVGEKKAPDSDVAGNANVLVFPDLQSGNIGYKIAQRLAGARAIGPVTQGLAKPVNDLSRGCSVQDIVDITAITAVQAQS